MSSLDRTNVRMVAVAVSVGNLILFRISEYRNLVQSNNFKMPTTNNVFY